MFFAAQCDCGGGWGGALLYNLNGLTSLTRTFCVKMTRTILCEDVAEVIIKIQCKHLSPLVSNLQYLTCMAVNFYQRTSSTWL